MLEVIKGGSNNPNSCAVRVDGITTKFTDFVSVGMSKGKATMTNNADPLTIAIAIAMLTEEFNIQFAACPIEQQNLIKEALQ